MNPGHGAGVAAADRRHLDDLALDELDPIVFTKNPGLAHPVVFIEREASAPERDRHGILSVDHLALPPCVQSMPRVRYGNNYNEQATAPGGCDSGTLRLPRKRPR